MCFRCVIGRDDIEGIEEYLKTHPGFDTVYIVCKEPLSDVVKSLIEEEDTDRIFPMELLKKLRAKKNFPRRFREKKSPEPLRRKFVPCSNLVVWRKA